MSAIEAEMKLALEMVADAWLMFEKKRWRSAVNRAYYGMFHATKATLLFLKVDCHSHAGAINRFGEHVVNKGLVGENLAKSLHRAYRLREKSDYQPITEIEKDDSEKILYEAEKFITQIKELLKRLKGNDGKG